MWIEQDGPIDPGEFILSVETDATRYPEMR